MEILLLYKRLLFVKLDQLSKNMTSEQWRKITNLFIWEKPNISFLTTLNFTSLLRWPTTSYGMFQKCFVWLWMSNHTHLKKLSRIYLSFLRVPNKYVQRTWRHLLIHRLAELPESYNLVQMFPTISITDKRCQPIDSGKRPKFIIAVFS